VPQKYLSVESLNVCAHPKSEFGHDSASFRPKIPVPFMPRTPQQGIADGQAGPSALASQRRDLNWWDRVAICAAISPMT
jgi:hypothetical protein